MAASLCGGEPSLGQSGQTSSHCMAAISDWLARSGADRTFSPPRRWPDGSRLLLDGQWPPQRVAPGFLANPERLLAVRRRDVGDVLARKVEGMSKQQTT